MSFIDVIKVRAKSEKKKIVLPETGDPRTLEAADTVLREGIADIILVGNEEEILSRAEGLDLSLSLIHIWQRNCIRTVKSRWNMEDSRFIISCCL